MVTAQLKEPQILSDLRLFIRVTGEPPRVWDGDWHPDDKVAADRLGIALGSPGSYVKQFGGIQRAITEASSLTAFLLPLIAIKVGLGRYPKISVTDTLVWDEESSGFCQECSIELLSPFDYGEVFGSVKEAILQAESLKKDLWSKK